MTTLHPGTDLAQTLAGMLGALCYVAASLVLCSLTTAFNPAALVIQIFFLTMSVAGLALRLQGRGRGTGGGATGSGP